MQVERGHVSLEERCQEGFGVDEENGLSFCTLEEDDELEVVTIWDDVYKEEQKVFNEGSGVPAATAEEKARRERFSRRNVQDSGFADQDWAEVGGANDFPA